MEHYYCEECEDCGGSFYDDGDGQIEVECPCCGSMNVQP